jgi:hypothetical protein
MSERRCTVEHLCTPYPICDGRYDPPRITVICKHCGREMVSTTAPGGAKKGGDDE